MPINHDMMHAQSPDDVAALKARIAELETELDAFEKSFNEMTEEYMKSQHALWLARAKRAKDKQQLFHFSLGYQTLTIEGFYDPYKGCRILSPQKWIKIFNNVENKCLKKAKEYK